MEIAALSIALSQGQVQQQAGISVMKMAMNVAETKGNTIESLASETAKAMESSIQPNLGTMIDIQT